MALFCGPLLSLSPIAIFLFALPLPFSLYFEKFHCKMFLRGAAWIPRKELFALTLLLKNCQAISIFFVFTFVA